MATSDQKNLRDGSLRKPVNRCVCHDVQFSEIKDILDKHHASTIEEIQSYKECAKSCKFCIPYIEKMIQTGETAFEVF